MDRAVIDLTKLANDGKLKTQRDYLYNLKNGGVGLGSVSPKVPKAFVAKTIAVGKLIATGKIKVKPASSSRLVAPSRGWATHPPLESPPR